MATPRQQNSGFASSATSLNVAFGSPVLQGSLLVAYVASPTTGRTCSASDNVNGAYGTDSTAASSCSICTFQNSAAGTPTVTGALSGGNAQLCVIIEEWPGYQTLDQIKNSSGAATTTGTTGTTATLLSSADLALGALVANTNVGTTPTTFAAAAPFTPDSSSPVTNSGSTTFLASGYQSLSSNAGVTATFNWTNSVNWRSCIATYLVQTLGLFTAQTVTSSIGSLTATVVQAPATSQAGGTGKPRRKVKRAEEIFQEEMAKIEAQLHTATDQREALEGKLSEVSTDAPIPADIQNFITDIEAAIDRAERRERARASLQIDVPVYFRTPKKSVGVERSETITRLQQLARIARYREQRAAERLRKLRDRIDEDAAGYFMNFLMQEDD